MSTDPKLPEGWREHPEVKRELREAFTTGWRLSENERGYSAPSDPHLVADEAKRRYPITRRVPRVVTDAHGVGWRLVGDEIRATETPGGSWVLHASRVQLWADLLQSPYTEVTE